MRTNVLTVEDVAAMAGMSARGIRLVIARGELPAIRAGRRLWLIPRKAGEQWARRYRAEHDKESLRAQR